MHFFKKKPRKPEEVKAWVEQNRARFSATTEALQNELTAIINLDDAGEKYLQLDEFEKKTASEKWSVSANMAAELSRRDEYLRNALGFPLVVIPPVGMLFYLFFVMTNEEEGQRKNGQKIADVCQETGFFDAFDGMVSKATALKGHLLANCMPDVAESKRFDDLYSRFPEVKDAFVRAAARERARENRVIRLDKPMPGQPKPD